MKFKEQFVKRHTLLIVVHSKGNRDEDFDNVQRATSSGADGIFLINHGCHPHELMKIALDTFERFNELWIGVNLLGIHAADCFSEKWLSKRTSSGILYLADCIKGLWVDNAGVYANDHTDVDHQEAHEIESARKRSGWHRLYFGGTAFKTQPRISAKETLEKVAKIATGYMDVVTTSGPRTGVPAELEKVRIMKEAIGDFPLALASGITPENVGDFMPYADAFLVATGVSKSFYELDSKKIFALAKKLER